MTRPRWRVDPKSLVDIEWQHGIPRLVIHEKYEKLTKWSLRSLTICGIGASVVTLPWYGSLSLAVAVTLLEQFLERTVFLYTSLYVQPMPTFSYDPNKWRGMGFAFPSSTKAGLLNVIGPAFDSEEYAKRFLELLRAWNYNEEEDRANNICLSFIQEDETEYSAYLYPNADRQTVSAFGRVAEAQEGSKRPGKRHQPLVMQIVFCKLFPLHPHSQLSMFVERQQSGKPFKLTTFTMTDGQVRMVEARAIIKYDYKFRTRTSLTARDYEYQHGRTVMKDYLATRRQKGSH